MTVYVVHFYVLSGVNQAGIRYYRQESDITGMMVRGQCLKQ